MTSPYVLAVMGVTGAGKSSFVKLVTGDPTVKIGHTQQAETKTIHSYDVNIRGYRFSLVDTPGFDDEDLTDSDVLKLLVDWLISSYKSGQKLNGILYLHRIADTRMRGSSLRNLKMFRELIGDEFHESLTLGTTCWSLVPFHVGLDRESELKTNGTFWKMMISKGAQVERIPEGQTEARDLVYKIARNGGLPLKTQRDTVDRGISFKDLAVTKLVNYEVDLLRRELEAETRRRREEHQRQLARQEEELQIRLAAEREAHERIMHHIHITQSCQRIRPYGVCDNKWCTNKLKRWAVIWHCCSCAPTYDNYWHCGPCGNDCGNVEHPMMTRIDNSDDCVVM